MPNYSLKPGRGPSAMGVVGGVVAVLFGVVWMVMAFGLTGNAPGDMGFVRIFPCFGIIFIIAAVAGIVFHLQNARGRNRFSMMDLVEGDAEPDPLSPRRVPPAGPSPGASAASAGFCRNCGAELKAGAHFCSRCGTAVGS